MAEAIIFLFLVAWALYQFFKTKNLRILLGTSLVILLQLTQWPFFLPAKLSLSLIAFSAAGFLAYQYWYAKKDKHVYQYVILFILFGAVLLVDLVFP